MNSIDTLRALFAERGGAEYLGEAVTQATHMLQAGALAIHESATPEQIAAALLHDVGHLVAPTSEHADARHEQAGAEWLSELGFPTSVTEPVRLHVAAKRYLCAVDPGYMAELSPASARSLALQGGPMTADEAAAFAQLEHAVSALAVRRWDEAAKDPARSTPAFDEFVPLLERFVR